MRWEATTATQSNAPFPFRTSLLLSLSLQATSPISSV
jgi:hypothetical protein